MYPSFFVPPLIGLGEALHTPVMLLTCLGFGLIIGAAAAFFIKGLYWSEDRFETMPGNYYTRHMLGMLIVGVQMALFMHFLGHYYIQGVGYATIMDILTGALTMPYLLLLLFVSKYVSTCLTLGSGASGGVFSPGLFMGACLGAAFGGGLNSLFPTAGFSSVAFAIAGMAGMVAGTTGAVMTASIMIFEQTRDYHVILPILITVSIAYAVRKAICDPSIYTMKLLRRGNPVPEGLEAAIHQARKAKDVMNQSYHIVNVDSLTASAQKTEKDTYPPSYFLIEKDEVIIGVVTRAEIAALPANHHEPIGDLPMLSFDVTTPDAALPHILRKMLNNDVDVMLVTKEKTGQAKGVLGLITVKDIAIMMEHCAALL
jgi:CIC family chloride channel protein